MQPRSPRAPLAVVTALALITAACAGSTTEDTAEAPANDSSSSSSSSEPEPEDALPEASTTCEQWIGLETGSNSLDIGLTALTVDTTAGELDAKWTFDATKLAASPKSFQFRLTVDAKTNPTDINVNVEGGAVVDVELAVGALTDSLPADTAKLDDGTLTVTVSADALTEVAGQPDYTWQTRITADTFPIGYCELPNAVPA